MIRMSGNETSPLNIEWALERWVEPAAASRFEWLGEHVPATLSGWTVLIGRHVRVALSLAAETELGWDRVRSPLAAIVVACLLAESTLNPYEGVAVEAQYEEALATLRLGADEDLDRPAGADVATARLIAAMNDLEGLTLAASTNDFIATGSLGNLEHGSLGLERLRSASLYELALAALYLIAAPIDSDA